MTQEQKILSLSIKHFEDKKKNTTCYPASLVFSSNGLSYILREEKGVQISCAFHISATQNQLVNGIYQTAEVVVNTEVDIFSLFKEDVSFYILNYNNFEIGINKSNVRNEVAGVWHYYGEILQNRNSHYVLINTEIEKTKTIVNSMEKWLEFGEKYNYSVFPSYLSIPDTDKMYITVEIENTISGNRVNLEGDTLNQNLFDEVRLYLNNANSQEAQEISYNIINQVLKYGLFGVCSSISWTQINDDVQDSFGIKSNRKFSKFKINYNYSVTSTLEAEKYIKEAYFNILPTEFYN